MFHQNSFLHPTEKTVAERRSHIRELLTEKLHFEKCADAELTPDDFDRLFEYQVWSRNPKLLSSDALCALDVCVKEDVASKAYHKLVREGYIIELPEPDINTDRMTSKFRHEFSFLPEWGQKRLAVLLLAWKREILRLKYLEEEQKKIEGQIAHVMKEGSQVEQELEQKLKDVKKEMKMKPTSRINITASNGS